MLPQRVPKPSTKARSAPSWSWASWDDSITFWPHELSLKLSVPAISRVRPNTIPGARSITFAGRVFRVSAIEKLHLGHSQFLRSFLFGNDFCKNWPVGFCGHCEMCGNGQCRAWGLIRGKCEDCVADTCRHFGLLNSAQNCFGFVEFDNEECVTHTFDCIILTEKRIGADDKCYTQSSIKATREDRRFDVLVVERDDRGSGCFRRIGTGFACSFKNTGFEPNAITMLRSISLA